MNRSCRRLAVLAAATAVLWVARIPVCTADCLPETVAIDTTLGHNLASCFMGEAVGETFIARDTLIRSITVWRVGGGYAAPMKLWILGTDARGVPLPFSVLKEGPTREVYADPAIRLIKMQYVFDPPFVLPRHGLYAFFVQDPCLSLFDVLINTSGDLYPEGQFWFSSRSNCHLQEPTPFELTDLIFEIEFCKEATTPVRATTWGRFKTIYR